MPLSQFGRLRTFSMYLISLYISLYIEKISYVYHIYDIYLFIYSYIYLSTYLCIYLSIHIYDIYLSIYLSIFLSFTLFEILIGTEVAFMRLSTSIKDSILLWRAR